VTHECSPLRWEWVGSYEPVAGFFLTRPFAVAVCLAPAACRLVSPDRSFCSSFSVTHTAADFRNGRREEQGRERPRAENVKMIASSLSAMAM
jgi:hypothetical protein